MSENSIMQRAAILFVPQPWPLKIARSTLEDHYGISSVWILLGINIPQDVRGDASTTSNSSRAPCMLERVSWGLKGYHV